MGCETMRQEEVPSDLGVVGNMSVANVVLFRVL